MTNITLQDLFDAGVYFGHRTRFWNPKMTPYIFGVRHKIHIINLDKTLPLLKDAVNFIGSVAAKRGKILFVGTKPAAQEIIRAEAERCGMPYVSYRWLGGMLTNYKTIRQSIKRLKDLEDLRNSPVFEKFTKKEALSLNKEIQKLEKNLGGVRNMSGLPDVIFVIDVGHENIAISEAQKLKIPVVGIVDTNCSPEGIDYAVPGNDDSIKAITLYTQAMANAIIDARSNLGEETAVEEAEEGRKVAKKTIKSAHKVVTKKIVKLDEEEPVSQETTPEEDEEHEQEKSADSKIKVKVKSHITEKSVKEAKEAHKPAKKVAVKTEKGTKHSKVSHK